MQVRSIGWSTGILTLGLTLVGCKGEPTLVPDSDADTDADTDTDTDADTDTDTDADIQAVADTFCEPHTLIGRVSLYDYGTPSARAEIAHGPLRLNDGPPVQTEGDCTLYRWDSSACMLMDCGPGTQCGYDAANDTAGCVPERVLRDDVTLTVSDGITTQVLDTPNISGLYDAELDGDLLGQPIRFELAWPGMRIVTPTFTRPAAALTDLTLTLETGDSCSPGDVDYTWSGPAGATTVRYRQNNNHHLPQDIFTICEVPATAGAMTIPGTFANQLSGSTCLESQEVEHVRSAAAELGNGQCVEFLWSSPGAFAFP